MTVADLAKRRELKTLVIDVERLQGTITMPFWSLNDYKNRRMNWEHVTEWPRTICAAWRWYGTKRIEFAAEWEHGAATFAEQLRNVMDQADIITGHYVNGADRKWLNSLFRDHNLRMPSPYKVIDTLAVARRELGDESMTLGALTTRYGIPTKSGHYNADTARAACNGDRTAQRELKTYNIADVEASTGLYSAMLPLTKNHPHVAPNLAQEANVCPRCASSDVVRDGTYTPGVYIYARYLCRTCTGWYRSNYETRGPSVKAL